MRSACCRQNSVHAVGGASPPASSSTRSCSASARSSTGPYTAAGSASSEGVDLPAVEQQTTQLIAELGREPARELRHRHPLVERHERDGRGARPRRRARGARVGGAARPAPGSARGRAPARPRAAARSRSRPIPSRSLARAARTDAERGEPVSSASSPSASPRPSSRTTAPVGSSTTSSRPARTTYIASPGSPSWNSHSPAGTQTRGRLRRELLAQLEPRARRTAGPRRGSRDGTAPGGRHRQRAWSRTSLRRARGAPRRALLRAGRRRTVPRGLAERRRPLLVHRADEQASRSPAANRHTAANVQALSNALSA